MIRRPRRFWPLYVAWITFCAILFLALRSAEDPSRPKGSILSIDAGVRAREILRQRGVKGYEVVHVARGKAGEGAAEDRWVVLLDKQPHTALEQALVVEMRSEDGTLLRIRKPATARMR